jgi:hypothetical protein
VRLLQLFAVLDVVARQLEGCHVRKVVIRIAAHSASSLLVERPLRGTQLNKAYER